MRAFLNILWAVSPFPVIYSLLFEPIDYRQLITKAGWEYLDQQEREAELKAMEDLHKSK